MKKLIRLISACRSGNSSIAAVFMRYIFWRLQGKNIISGRNVLISGGRGIETNGFLKIAIDPVGFMHENDYTWLNIRSRLQLDGDYSIGKGCRFDVGANAIVRIGKQGFINAKTNFVIYHGLTIGNDSAISWNCQFLDEDFHEIKYSGRKKRENKIEIGSHVWIGCNVIVLKGSKIPNGCVVAAGSVVSSKFDEPNCLIAGNPAKIIKREISWN